MTAGRKSAAKTAKLASAIAVVLLFGLNASVLVHGSSPQASFPADANAFLDQLWTAESDQLRANLGYSVSSAGDVNNDGFGDVIVGALNFDNGQTDEGRALLYMGSASGLSSSYAWSAESDQAYARFGYSVSSAGDVDNDGFDEILVGAYVFDNGQTDEGRAYLYSGSASGLLASHSWSAEGNQASGYFGSSVSSAGDVNNDGYGDVLVAALFYSNGENMEGRVFLYLGSSTGLSASPSWTAEGNQAFAYFGRSVSSAGDVNNDGYDDVVIGAYYYDNGESNEGRAFLYLGSASGLSTTPIWTGESDQANAQFGYSVSSAGDVNNDGYSDVITSAVGYHNPEANEGRAYVYLGSASGLSASPSWTVESDQANAYLGVVSSAGDVNNDGFGDVLVGAYFYDNDTLDEGRVYLYLGSTSGPSAAPSWTAESDQYSTMFGSSLSTAGDVDSDGYDEIIVGSYSYDNGQEDEGRAYLYSNLALPPQPIQFDLVLVAGWNFVSVPVVGTDYRASTLGLPKFDLVAGYNPLTGLYDKNYVVGVSPAPLDFPIMPSTGYWIYANAAETLHLSGVFPTVTQTLTINVQTNGWAAIGFCSSNSTWKASMVPSMFTDGNISTVASYDPVLMNYRTYIKGIPATDFALVPGQALWIFCTSSGVLAYAP
jgi:hypothetical protein